MSAGLPGPAPATGLQSALKAALNSQGGPNNPATPAYRENPEHGWYLRLQAIRASAREATEHVGDEKGPTVKAIFSAIRTAADQLMSGIDPDAVATSTAATLVKTLRPDIAAQLEMAKQPGTPPGLSNGEMPIGPVPPAGGALTSPALPGASPPAAIPPPVQAVG